MTDIPEGSAALHPALRRVLEATQSAAPGREFFVTMLRSLLEVSGMRSGYLAEFAPPNRFRTLACVEQGELRDDWEWEVREPGNGAELCSAVRLTDEDACLLHGRDELQRLSIQGYVGVPVRGRRGTPLGVLALFDEQGSGPHAPGVELLQVCSARVAAELELLRLERALAERTSLSTNAALYRQIVTTCQEGVWIVDGQGKTTYVNEQLAAMLGRQVDAMRGQPVTDFMDPSECERALTQLENVRNGAQPRLDVRLRHADGSEIAASLSMSPLRDDSKQWTGVLALVSDNTERRRMERRLHEAQRLESLAILAGGIAHEFNNLLVGMLGNASLALLDVAEDAPIRPILTDLRDSAVRAAELTKQMLAYSGKGRFQVQRLNLNSLIEDMRPLVLTMVSKKANLRYSLSPTLLDVQADGAQLRQILLSVLCNASDALAEGVGTIAVSTGMLEADVEYLATTFLAEAAPGTYAYVDVKDDGCGMDALTLSRIFEPFFSTKFAGRGLGLSATLGMLRAHGGAIKVDSESGRGTTVRILFPAAPDAQPAPPSSSKLPAGERPLILIVDDEAAVRNVAGRILTRNGYEVLFACNGQEAVELFEQQGEAIALVLLDMTMPELSGFEVFEVIRRMRPDVRVVLTSGYGQQDAARFVGLSGFLRKPWLPSELLAIMKSALEQEPSS